ncbi:baeRF12 domain-containing protein [Pelagerythrobacter marinus]|uniref:Attachment protein n=1 Tax=Pelagerythrobacter marinus TaxID=538382 RepID=A0ABW9UYY9_9SPHN|nr:host attachment protein [Pelagerythrobacter marinus]MXO69820.1 attachment protein [Pelagerythrobacter marinus]USA38827.1 host attachment protein [Pelagerythrobacter marinus]WPZ07095.1 host attachment protein [Pelagerythrobacter marinus]
MKLPHNAHVALVDGTTFVVMRNKGKPFEPELETVAKPDLEATNFSAGVRHQDPTSQMPGRNDLNELAHGAAAAEWLNAKAIADEIEAVLVIADPKTLGEMRHHYHGELEKRLVGEIPKTMTGETSADIAQAIAAA